MMLIYIPSPSIRAQYVFDFVLQESLNTEYEFTSNLDFFRSADNPFKWAYGEEIESIPCLPAAALLWQKDIQHQACTHIIHEDIVPIFHVDEIRGINFDVFASIFYLISRYEEYLPCVKDNHGRYAAIQSIALQYGFLETAMVNRYILWLAKWLRSNYPDLDLKLSKPKSLLSVDIDHPFYTRDVSLGKWLKRSLKEMSFLSEKDKYDTTEYMLDKMGDLASIFFILCPQQPSDIDHFNHRDSEAFLSMIDRLRSRSKIGLHPSYYAEDRNLMSEELAWFAHQHQRQIKSLRFHYLRFDVETTPDILLAHDIQNDFSLGYGTHIGFRTSTSLPFYWFDLKKNRKTSLKIYTPCLMDSLFKHHGKQNYREHLLQLVDEVKNYGGVFIPIFHNDIIADEEWREHFEYSVELMKKMN